MVWSMRIVLRHLAFALLIGSILPQSAYAAASPCAEPFTTRAGCAFGNWLSVFNQGDADALQGFLDTHFAPSALTGENQIRLRRRTGGYEFVALQSEGDDRIEAVLKANSWGYYVRITMEVASTSEGQITALQFLRVPRPETVAAEAPFDIETIGRLLSSEFENEAAQARFSGVIMVARKGVPLAASAFGLSDREMQIPNTLETKFRVGSMNKMFTGIAIAQLVERGRLSYSDTLAKHLPDYPNVELAAKVTVAQLLLHTAGMGDIFGAAFETHRETLRTLGDYVTLYGDRPQEFLPGSRFVYSNYGYILLGWIIENVSGLDYYDFVRQNIFVPAGMAGTDSLPEDTEVPDRAIGYTRRTDGNLEPNNDTLPYRGTSAGGGYATAGDLVRFADALMSFRLLSEESTKFIMRGKSPAWAMDLPMLSVFWMERVRECALSVMGAVRRA